jgi:hypothetical protein
MIFQGFNACAAGAYSRARSMRRPAFKNGIRFLIKYIYSPAPARSTRFTAPVFRLRDIDNLIPPQQR